MGNFNIIPPNHFYIKTRLFDGFLMLNFNNLINKYGPVNLYMINSVDDIVIFSL